MLSIPSTAFLDQTPEEEFEIFQIESNQISSGSLIRQIIKEGIVLNCLPRIGNIVSPNLVVNSQYSILKNSVNKEISIFQINSNLNNLFQKDTIVSSSFFNDSKKENDNLLLLNDQSLKKTNVTTDFDIPYKEDERFNKNYLPFNENIVFPNVFHLLNNIEEAVLFPLVSYDDNIKMQYIKKFNYPINYNNSLDLNLEGKNLEPLAFMNEIQFKSKQEYEPNRFWASINNSINTRNQSISYSDATNLNDENFTSYYENIIPELYFVENYTLKNFISTESFAVLPQQSNIISFKDEDINEVYSLNNYHDLTFKNIFKNLRLYEEITNRENNILYKENDKFTSCGFDYSYTNSLGKNSIAFKGLE